ncbi:hypothetical protein [Haladaptatus sp. DJG-WS-42]|uniref:hypothetical protein n=1 Tax=Haladaptatus sp. DJG-WS-42 TaxID=3120516 RepID=UPI0030CFFC42
MASSRLRQLLTVAISFATLTRRGFPNREATRPHSGASHDTAVELATALREYPIVTVLSSPCACAVLGTFTGEHVVGIHGNLLTLILNHSDDRPDIAFWWDSLWLSDCYPIELSGSELQSSE